MNLDHRPMVVDASRLLSARLRDDQLTIETQAGEKVTVPIGQIGQLTIVIPDNGLLALIARMVDKQRPVALINRRGHVVGRVRANGGTGGELPHQLDLCHTIEQTAARRYTDWVDVQRRHNLSRIFPHRAARHDAPQRCLDVLRRRCRQKQPAEQTRQAEVLLVSQTQLLAQRVIDERRLYPLQKSLARAGHDLVHDLAEITRPLLLFAYLSQLPCARRTAEHHALAIWAAQQEQLAEQLVFHIKALPNWLRRSAHSGRNGNPYG